MNLQKKYRLYSKVAFTLAVIMLAEIIYPTAALALTSGPGNPEFSSFEPVATTSMVNEFNGGFTYNIPVIDIPGANGGGYACSLAYHSGETVESEASWVGYGWSLNPGAINRSKRGIADDIKGENVTYKNNVPPNWTISAGVLAGNIEAFSVDVPVSLNASLRYNNYKGFGYTAGIGYSFVKGIVSLGYSVSDGSGSYSVNINPAAALNKQNDAKTNSETRTAIKLAKDKTSKEAILKQSKGPSKSDKEKKAEKREKAGLGALGKMGSAYGMHCFSDDLRPTNLTPYNGTSFNMTISAVIDPAVFPIGGEFGFHANLTTQTNISSRTVPTYGYLYTKDAISNSSSMMDYYVEKEATYNKRDRYMSIPFSNADIYSVTGEGVGGGFRLYNKNVNTFYPNEVSSTTTIVQTGMSAQVGLDIGLGFNLGVGQQTLDVKRTWPDPGNTGDYGATDNSNDDEGCFFRFNNDLGGGLNYTKSTTAVTAGLDQMSDVPGLKTVQATIPYDDIYKSLTDTLDNGAKRSGRSSYIAYHTNSEMLKTSNGKNYYTYQKNSAINGLVNRSDVQDGIGELAVNNEDGNHYVYGLPVYSKAETSMQYDVDAPGTEIQNNFIAYKTSTTNKIEVGEIHDAPYATSYLLTEITSPDYVDRKLDGPTDDDFGGYTKFSYSQAYGTYNKAASSTTGWYHWRVPYTGLTYNPNDLTDNTDDVGSFTSGYKESYYLTQIETKTHIAVFVTNKTNFTLGGTGGVPIKGSGAVRQDGLEADADANAIGSKTAKGNSANQKLQMLERIELYAKPTDGSKNYKLLKTTHFEYDYSICGYVPNNIGSAVDKNGNTPSTLPNINANHGKLTLKKVWFEYEGVANAKISPYKFDYKYPTGLGTNGLSSAYSTIAAYGSGFVADSIQNPRYSPFNLDRWGNPQPNGEQRHDSLMTHLDQTVDMTKFDPAAWQLKKITLPSGGQILVQYEQNDYLQVQNRNALAMVSLKPYSSLHTTLSQLIDNKFYLNVEDDLGITTSGEKQKLVSKIRQEFLDKKIFFKYFYALVGPSADLHSCYSDYVKGYVNVDSCNVDSDGVYLKLGTGNPFSPNSYELPRNVCIDYVKKEKGGKLKPIGNCNAAAGGIAEGNSPTGVAQQLISKIGTTLFPALTCLSLNEKLSYLRIPVLHGKKGGGIRVKRILMHDNGIDNGDENLYGSEYIYQTTDGETSGVATNEPTEGKEENALITFLPKRNDQSIANRLIAGKDKEQFEGPIGEYLLPAPSVGYSRIIVKNIHDGKTNTGFVVHEFFTAADYPFDKYYHNSEIDGTAIDQTGIQQKKDWLMIPASFVNISISNLWLTQGYRFIINEMHGQPKSTSTYSGDYNSGVPDNLMLSSRQEFTYYEPGESIPMMMDINSIVPGNPGKETEVVMERKSVEDISQDGDVEVDLSVGLLPLVFPVYGSAMPSYSYSESKLLTHVTTKIVRYPAIQKSVTTYQDGIYHLTENVAFSPYTGKPLLTETTDGYDALSLQQSTNHNGNYLTYSIPAAKEYPEMGQKAANERLKVTMASPISCALTSSSGVYTMTFSASTGTVCSTMDKFNRGDLILVDEVTSGSNQGHFFHVDEKSGSGIKILPAKLYNGSSTVYTASSVTSIEIIKSGRTNQLNTLAGSFTTYGVSPTISDTSGFGAKQNFVNNLNTALHAPLAISSVSSSIHFPPGHLSGYFALSISSDTILSLMEYHQCCYVDPGKDCKSVLGSPRGYFALDKSTGQVFYYLDDDPCNPIGVSCLNSSPNKSLSLNNVVAATASTFNYNWPFDTATYQFSDLAFAGYNDYETGIKGKWRMQSAYAYNSPVTSGSKQGTTERNYKNAGVFPMTLFNWKNTQYNDTALWVRTSSVNSYSPNGEATEEKDAIGIKSAAKYGYKGMLPYLITQNSDYRSSQFESFENTYPYAPDGTKYKLEEGITVKTSQVDVTKAHSGSASLELLNTTASTPGTPSTANFVLKPVKLTSQISGKGLEIKVWVKDPGYSAIPVTATLNDSTTTSITQPVTFSKVAQTGEWTLYAAKVTSFVTGLSTIVTTISSTYPTGSTASPIWIDDVRVQPFDAQVMAYVYDTKTLRLLASFDDQHFGLYYQYNAEGKLVRKKIETEKGTKTIQETQYHTPVEARQ